MQSILARWGSLSRDNLFEFWQEELKLKIELRKKINEYSNIQLNNEAEYHFLRQSLGYGAHRVLFYTILFFNMSNLQVQEAVLKDPLQLYLEFLKYLPQIILKEKPSARTLQFLISLYREEFNQEFYEIVQVLNESQCDYLMERTANKNFRQLLGNRLLLLKQHLKDAHYGLFNNIKEYPGLYGNKMKIIVQTAELIEKLKHNGLMEQDGLETLLEMAELLYKTGLLDDCHHLLVKIYDQTISLNQNERSSSILKMLNKLVQKTLPIYYLLKSPIRAYHSVLESYHLYFPVLPVDDNLILSLKIYSILLLKGDPQYTLTDILRIKNNNNSENLLFSYLQKAEQLTEDYLYQLALFAHENISINPHESFIIMEIICWLKETKQIRLTQETSAMLLNDYLQYYQWIPSSLFLNSRIYHLLAAGVDEMLQNKIKHLLQLRNQFSPAEMQDIYMQKYEFFIDNQPARQLLLGSFLGVGK